MLRVPRELNALNVIRRNSFLRKKIMLRVPRELNALNVIKKLRNYCLIIYITHIL